MTAITFPNSPASGDTHTAGNGIVYTYDGEKWTSIGTNSAGTWTRSGTTVSLTTAGDDLNVDSGTLFVDASANSVGIGSTTPSSYNASADNLVIQNSDGTGAAGITIRAGTGSQSTVYFADGTGTSDAVRGYVQYFHNGDFLRLGTDANERFRIDSNGRCLLGTTTEGYATLADKLTIANAGHCGMTIRSGSTHNGSIYFSDATSGTSEYDGYIEYQHTDRRFLFGTATGTRMTIDSGGKLGVGTSDPSVLLHIAATEPQFYIQDSNSTGNNVNATLQFRDSSNTQQSYYGYASGSDSHLSLFNTMSSGNLRFGTESNERLTITSDGKIGVGTISPSQILEIKSAEPRLCINATSASADLGIEFEANGTRLSHIFHNHTSGEFDISCGENTGGSHFMTFKTGNGSEKMRLDSSGRLLLGTATEATNAEVTVRATAPQLSLYATPGNISRITLGDTDDWNIGQVGYDNSDNSMFFSTNNATRMSIDSSGRLGLGTQSPTSALTINSATNAYMVQNRTNCSSIVGPAGVNASDGVLFGTTTNSPFIFYVNSSEKGRMDTSGRLNIGTTVGAAGRPVHIHTAGSGSSYFHSTNDGTGDEETEGVVMGMGSATDAYIWNYANGMIQFATNGAARMTIDNSGQCGWYRNTSSAGSSIIYAESDVIATKRTQWYVLADGDVENRTGVYTTISSDERMKKDIVDASSQWEDIKNIRMRKFRYKANGDESPLQLGVVAQELEAVCPNLVTRKPATAEMSAESEGLIAEGEDILSWKQSIVHLKALKALQEAMERIETLEAEVAALKSA